MLLNIVGIGIGGALGAIVRYALGHKIMEKWNRLFPLGTFVINITGAFILCLLAALFTSNIHLTPVIYNAMSIGFLGAYTTFSTFAYETISLLENGEINIALLYSLGSVLSGLTAGWLGLLIGSRF